MFLASSVVRAIRNNQTIDPRDLDLVICPTQSCAVRPEECYKGRTASCVKKVGIVYEHDGHNKVTVLAFYYLLQGYDREGFIKTGDRSLNVLIDRDIIHRTDLIEN